MGPRLACLVITGTMRGFIAAAPAAGSYARGHTG